MLCVKNILLQFVPKNNLVCLDYYHYDFRILYFCLITWHRNLKNWHYDVQSWDYKDINSVRLLPYNVLILYYNV